MSERVERDNQRAAEGGRGVLQTGSDPDSELRSKKDLRGTKGTAPVRVEK